MKQTISSFAFSALLLAPALASAQGDSAVPYTPAEPGPAAPTLESLQSELRALEAREEQQRLRHEADIKALQATLAEREAEAAVAHERELVERDRLLRIYGFADVGFKRNIAPKDGAFASQFSAPATFYLGRLNLYYDVRPDPDFRFLAETRFSLYPNGSLAGTSSTGQAIYTSTTVRDVSSPNSAVPVSWGSVIIERAVLDWTRYPLFSVRVGLFLTPFGIYNVDHGSPTLISVTQPAYIGSGWIPERQIGLQIFGSHPVERWELGYALTVGNGRTEGTVDVADSKGWGGRIYAGRQGELGLLLGASALYQPYRRNRDQYGLDGNGNVTFVSTRAVERNTLTLGLDQSVDYRGLRVRNELVYYQLRYEPGRRDSLPEARGGLEPNARMFNWSMIVAYRLWEVEPYYRLDYYYMSPTQARMTQVFGNSIGLNVYFRPNISLKVSWADIRFYKDDDPTNLAAGQNFQSYNGALVWAF